MEEIVKFLKEAETYYLATVEGDRPRVRPFGTAHIFEGKLYIQTGKKKDVSKQLHANPKAELCAFKGGEWIRVAGELVEDDRVEARQSMRPRQVLFAKRVPVKQEVKPPVAVWLEQTVR